MKKVIVIGSGLAGLSAAAYLSSTGKFEVEVLESSPKPGGRAYSFHHSPTNDIIDNGQHIMMGCYSNMLEFFSLIGSMDSIDIQPKLSVNFVDKEKGLSPLKIRSKLYPINLLSGLLSYKAIGLKDRLKILSLLAGLFFVNEKSLDGKSVQEWLMAEKQTSRAIKAFWEILAVGALNSDISQASAGMFVHILKKMFLRGNKAASIILPRTDLSQMYCAAAADFLSSHNGCLHFSEPVKSLLIRESRVEKVITGNREITEFDYVVSAIPAYSFERILPAEFHQEYPFDEIKYSSILSAHLWLKANKFREKFYGLIDSPVHWVFNHDGHITIVISSADFYSGKSKEEIYNIIISELKRYFPFFSEREVSCFKIIKEKRATFVPEGNFLKQRPGTITPISNLFLAGDWTNTGLPATIEGAIKSGKTAAAGILKTL